MMTSNSLITGAPKLRLLYLVHQFYPEYRNGTEKFVLQLAHSIQRRSYQVQVVTYGAKGFKGQQRLWRWLGRRWLQQRYVYAGVPVLAVRHIDRPPAHHQQVADESERIFARRYLQQWRPDLVHVGHAMRMSGFVWAAQELGIPTVLTLTDYWFICPKFNLLDSQGAQCCGPSRGKACQQACSELAPAFVRSRLAQAELLVRRAAVVAAPSRYLAEVFQREWPWLNLQIVPHGIRPWTHNTRRKVRGDGMVFAYAGSLTRHKGVHTLIEAFRYVHSSATRLVIYGAGPDEVVLRKLAAGDPRIQFCGVYDEQRAGQVFDTMDVLVAPSEWPENRPFVVHEALASGVPVIASAVGGMIDAVEDGVTGFVVPPGNVAALQTVLQRLVDAPERLNQVKERIADLEIPTIAREADAYDAVYRALLERRQ